MKVIKFRLKWFHLLVIFYLIAFGGVAWHTYQVDEHIRKFQNPDRIIQVQTIAPINDADLNSEIESGLNLQESENSNCYKTGKRYQINLVLADQRACDLEITKSEDLNILKKNSKLLNHVRSIFFRETKVTRIPPEIADLKNLQTLYFLETVNTSLPKEIGEVKKLTSLNFNQTDIAIIPEEITGLPNLETFSLTGNAGLVKLPDFTRFTGLRILFLGYNPGLEFAGESADNFSIEEVNLAKSTVNEIPDFLLRLKRLKLLILSENIMDPAEIKRIRMQLPNTNVVYTMSFLD